MRWKRIGILLVVLLGTLLSTLWWYHSRHDRSLEPLPQVRSRPTPALTTPVPTQRPRTPPPELSGPNPAELRDLTRSEKWPRLIYIPQGGSATIFASLKRQGLPLWGLDRFLLLPSKVRPGWIRIEAPISLKEFFEQINDFPREKTRRAVMYSGDSLDDFIRKFSRQTRLDKKALYEAYFRFSPYIEGGILAGFYRLPYRLTPGPAMAYLTEKSEEAFRKLAERYLGEYDPAAFKRYLIVASIIQRESWKAEEMPLIAAVIYNRLKRGMKLQMDATLNYGPWSHRRITPERIRRDTSRFNTYRYKGLPPEPIGSVTIDALKAALTPAKTEDLYFVRNIYGTHDFAATYAGHLANISRIKAQRAKLEKYKHYPKAKKSKK